MTRIFAHIGGLGTDPHGDLCGIRPMWERLARIYPDATFEARAWNNPGLDLWYLNLFARFDEVHIGGHSHGAGELSRLVLHVTPEGRSVDTCVLLDECPFARPAAYIASDITPKKWPRTEPGADHPLIRYGLACWQRNDSPFWPRGIRYENAPDENLLAIDAGVLYGVHHIDPNGICACPELQNWIQVQIGTSIARRMALITPPKETV